MKIKKRRREGKKVNKEEKIEVTSNEGKEKDDIEQLVNDKKEIYTNELTQISTTPTVSTTTEVKQTTSNIGKSDDLTLEEEQTGGKEVYVIYGDKGDGKTTLALSFPGEILALSYDRKTAPIRWYLYKDRKDIHVYDPIKFWVQTDDRSIVATAKKGL